MIPSGCGSTCSQSTDVIRTGSGSPATPAFTDFTMQEHDKDVGGIVPPLSMPCITVRSGEPVPIGVLRQQCLEVWIDLGERRPTSVDRVHELQN